MINNDKQSLFLYNRLNINDLGPCKQCKQWFDQLLGPGAVEIFANKQ